MPFPASLNLSSLNGTNGFRVDGVGHFGKSVASAGDVNGDGYDDFIVGAPDDPGASYVVFGKASGFPASFSVSALTGANGFRINGPSYGHFGVSVSSAGDVNNDGYADLIIGADYAQPNGVNVSGAAYVLFGKASGFAAVQNVSSLNGTNGFSVSGAANDYLNIGHSVANAGDINGDGYDDMIIGAYQAGRTAFVAGSGAGYVLFGKANGFPANINLETLNGSNGFRLFGEAPGDNAGWAVSAAGDVNGDGLNDLLIGAPSSDATGQSSGAAYVVFGKTSPFAADINLSTLNGANGFQISGRFGGDGLGWSVSSAGDINGDGYADVIVGATGVVDAQYFGVVGATYVIFGKASGFASDLNVSSLDGKNGFRLTATNVDRAGNSVASAGDVNGDGYGDLIVGQRYGSARAAYVVFGKASGFTATVNPATLDGVNGFQIQAQAAETQAGFAVSSAGDINNDGYDDLIVGDPDNGLGAVHIVFGQATPQTFVGTAGADDRHGDTANDTLSGLGGNDILRGLAGDDTLDGGDLSDQLFGGDGADDLVGGGGGDLLYGEAGADELKGGDGADKLFGGAGADALLGEAGNDRMEGGDDADSLTGGAGNDYLDGGAGVDTMTGGAENDVYIVDNAGDQTIELAGQGFDIVRAGMTWTLAANLEGLELQGLADIDGTGNGGANNLQGNAGANRLDGGAGVDTINGGDGDDIILGGLGNDLLRGGLGADTFIIDHAFGAVLETDQLYDFSTAEGDIIDLSGAYAGTLSVVGAFGKHAGEMTLTFASGITTVRLDINGDGKTDYQVKINGDVTGETGNWIL